MLEKFTLDASDGARQYYEEHGYVVFEDLIPPDRIDNFIRVYSRAKGDKWFVFPTQSTHRPDRFLPDEYGHVPESMENPAYMAFRPRFSDAVRECILHPNIAAGLRILDDQSKHVLWQSMFFDKSTGTISHQDS